MPPAMQLGLFEHSRDVMLRNDVLDALLRGDAGAARHAWLALQAEVPDDRAAPDLDALVSAIEGRSIDRFAAADAAQTARRALEGELAAAARRALGERAADWVAQRLRELARRAAALPFDADRADGHAASLWLAGGDWAAAAEAAQGIASWRRVPAPPAWVAEARCRLAGAEAAWPLLAELAWIAPGRLAGLLDRLPDASLQALRKAFGRDYEGDDGSGDLAWWPAWALIERPTLAPVLETARAGAATPPERALRLMLELLRLERQGRHREMVERRQALRSVNAALCACYIKTR